jgi:hypothetical protein
VYAIDQEEEKVIYTLVQAGTGSHQGTGVCQVTLPSLIDCTGNRPQEGIEGLSGGDGKKVFSSLYLSAIMFRQVIEPPPDPRVEL